MRCLCEKIARAANHDDGSSGRFWAGRFKSVALLDEAAILACSVYVDLNPIRAGLATTPEESAYTSGRDRIRSMLETSTRLTSRDEHSSLETCERPDAWLCELTLQETATRARVHDGRRCRLTTARVAITSRANRDRHRGRGRWLPACCRFRSSFGRRRPSRRPATSAARASDQGFLPIQVEHYVMLLDWTGRELRADKRGAIPDHLAPIMERLGLDQSNWVETVRGFGRMFKQAAGRSSSLVDAAARRSRRWFQGKAAARAAFV